MTLVAAKCPNCAANIEVLPETETTKCKSCGSAILVQDAIQKFKIEVSGQISLSGISSVENDIERGKQCLAAKDWQAAFKFFSSSINKQASNFDAWLGCLDAVTQNYNAIDFSWVQFSGAIGLEAIVQNSINYSPKEVLSSALSKVDLCNRIIRKQIESDAEIKRKYAQNWRRVAGVFFFLCCIGPLISILTSTNSGDTGVLIIFIILGFVVVGLLLWRPVKPDQYYDQTLIQYTSVIEKILAGSKV